jgi:hypothetical protein
MSVPPSDEITVETGPLTPPSDDATVEVPMPRRVANAVGSGWGLIQGHRHGRTLFPRLSLRQLVEAFGALMLLAVLSPLLIA